MRRLCLITALLLVAAPVQAGRIEGTVTFEGEGVRLVDLRPIVAFVESRSASPLSAVTPAAATLRQLDARFDPELLVVSVGQPVHMPNLDNIFHNVFSFSRPNDFDLGLYPQGETRTMKFEHAGVVRIYCSIHESMSGVIVVAPSPWFAMVDSTGRFEIGDLPAGEYELTVWSEKLPMERRAVSVPSEGKARLDVSWGGSRP